MSTTVTITRAERDLIRTTAGYWMYVDEAIPFGNRDEATETLRKLQRLAMFYDELGWDEDDPRQAFVTTADVALLEVLALAHDHAVDEVKGETEYRETHILKLRPTRYGTSWEDDFHTVEEANAKIDRNIRRAEEEQRVTVALLDRMGAGVTA